MVTKVYDGDTLTFMPDDQKKGDAWKIRLAEIDAPESDQPCGLESAQFLRVMTCNLIDKSHYRSLQYHISKVLHNTYIKGPEMNRFRWKMECYLFIYKNLKRFFWHLQN